MLEQKEAEDLHAFQFAGGWVTSKPPEQMASKVEGPLHRIHYQIFQEVIEPEDSKGGRNIMWLNRRSLV